MIFNINAMAKFAVNQGGSTVKTEGFVNGGGRYSDMKNYSKCNALDQVVSKVGSPFDPVDSQCSPDLQVANEVTEEAQGELMNREKQGYHQVKTRMENFIFSTLLGLLAFITSSLVGSYSKMTSDKMAARLKKKRPSVFCGRKVAIMLACSFVLTHNCFVVGSDEKMGVQYDDNDAQPFSLEQVSHSLRHGSSDGENPASIMVGLTNLMHLISSKLGSMQRHYKSGDKENAAAEFKSLVGTVDNSVMTSTNLKQIAGSNDLPEMFGEVASKDANSVSLQDIPNTMLGEFIKPEIYDDLVYLSVDFATALKEMDLSPLMTTQTPTKKKAAKPTTSTNGQFFKGQNMRAKIDEMIHSGSGNKFGLKNSGHFNFAKYPTLENQQHQAKLSSRMPKLNTFLSAHEHAHVLAKHKVRQDAIGDVCLPQCEINDSACNCAKLFECVKNIDEYDLAVLSAGGYIETTEGSDKYGEFSVSADELNLYDLDTDIGKKLKDVKSLVDSSSSSDETHCMAVLNQFHSACDPNKDSCSKANQQSFQVTIDQVCEAVNTKTKLKFERIGDEFDGFTDKSAQPVSEPLSYDACQKFATQFENLYEARDTTTYPHPNPMRKNASASLKTATTSKEFFDQIQFPVEYNFPRDNTGVVSRTFEEENFYGANQYDRVFMLKNSDSGRTLELACDPTPTSHVSKTSDKFKLNEDDQLESVECPGKVVSLLGPDDFYCLDGIKLYLDASPDEDDQAQKWRFYQDGIVNLRCGRTNENLAITEIKDDSFDDITFLDKIDFSMVNMYNGKAIGVGNALNFRNQCFTDYSQLKNAVAACASPSDQDGDACIGVKKSYGWPMNLWCFDPTIDSMQSLFEGVKDFNEDISAWDVSDVKVMTSMFQGATEFNQDLRRWDTSAVEAMDKMFKGATKFNSNIGEWNTWKCKDMTQMFEEASSFNSDITGWDTSNIHGDKMKYMFNGASKFNQGIGKWDVSQLTDVQSMFQNAQNFNGDISSWSTGNVKNMNSLFEGATKFNIDISVWDTSQVESMHAMFQKAKEFNQDISQWETKNVKDMEVMFNGASNFNQNLCDWKDKFPYTNAHGIFEHSGCSFQERPAERGSWFGPFCESECKPAWRSKDIGDPKIHGTTTPSPGVIAVSGSGYDIFERKDQFHYYYQPSSGNDEIGMLVEAFDGRHEWSKGGLMIRNTLDPDSAHFSLFFTGRNGLANQWRTKRGWNTKSENERNVTLGSGTYLNITKTANSFQAYYKKKGARQWESFGDPQTLDFTGDTFFIGIAVTSHDTGKLATIKGHLTNHNQKTRRLQSSLTKMLQVTHNFTDSPNTTLRGYNSIGIGRGEVKEVGFNKEMYSPSARTQQDASHASLIDSHTESDTLSPLPLNLQDFDGSSGQLFRISRDKHEKKVFKIHSSQYPEMLVSLSGGDCENNTNVILMPDQDFNYGKWKIREGVLENVFCNDMVIDISGSSHDKGSNIHIDVSNNSPGQKWTVKSSDSILMKATGSDASEKNSNQTWTPYFVDSGYDLGLHPGFPGEMITTDRDQYLSSTADRDLAKSAMHTCDKSMSLLVGSKISVGTLTAIADLVNEKGPDRMPGYCCMDVSTNSEFLGYDFNPATKDENGNVMECMNKGAWHLGISGEACENAGGKWIRSSCVTLQETINNRPSRFDLGNPMEGTCQDNLQRLNTAFVSATTSHQDFPFQGTILERCNKFCRSLPNYPLQTGMMTVQPSSEGKISEGGCTCLYQNNELPSRELMPDYAVSSPPKFTLTNANGMALGIRPKIDCDSDHDLIIEAQLSDPSNPRQQFQITQEGQVVSVQCPEKVMSVSLRDNGTCGAGIGLKLSSLNTDAGASAMSAPRPSDLQQWIFNKGKSSISNVGCPELAVSTNKENDVRLNSMYFALQNPRTQLAIGVKGTEDGCVDGMILEMQEMAYGSPNQQFIYVHGESKIASMLCPDYVVVVPDGNCDTTDGIYLSSETYEDDRNKWLFVDQSSSIKSLKCPEKFITINVALGGTTKMSTRTSLLLKTPPLPDSPRPYDDNETTNTTSYTDKMHVQIEWEAAKAPTTGSTITLSNMNAQRYQKWIKEYQHFHPLMGPFSLVNPTSGQAITVEDGICANGMSLISSTDDPTNERQSFYLGYHGSIFSMICPGLVIALEEDLESEPSLNLQTFNVGKSNLKWKFSNGMIESVLHPGLLVIADSTDSSLALQSNTTAHSKDSSWSRINTRLSHLNNDQTSGWLQEWTVSFALPGFENIALGDFIRDDTKVTKCYTINSAFSASFDDLASKLVIDDSSDEEQCKKAREGLGFDKDYPFDTDIRDSFYQHQCDPFFTGVDHMSEPDLDQLAGPPKFEMVEYKPVEYEAVEYDEEGEKQYVTVDYEEFSRGDDLGDLTETAWPDIYVAEQGKGDLSNILPVDSEGAKDQGFLTVLKKSFGTFDGLVQQAQMVYTFITEKTDTMCATMPENPCAGAFLALTCLPNPAYFICRVAKVMSDVINSTVFQAVQKAYQTLKERFAERTLNVDQTKYGYFYARATYLNTIGHYEWNQKALEAIRVNVKDQHMQMKKQLQERHKDIANFIGEDIADAQNALGQVIVDAQNDLDRGIIEAQNSLGQAIFDARNSNGQAIIDAQNYITLQHNKLSEWLHDSLCSMYEAMSGTCERVIGPLQKDQEFFPIQFYWPDGQLDMTKRLEQIQTVLSVDAQKYALPLSSDEARPHAFDPVVIKNTFDAISKDMEHKVDVMEGKLDALSEDVQGKIDSMEDKINAVQNDLKEMKSMMSQLLNMVTSE